MMKILKELGDLKEAESLLSEAKRIFTKTNNLHFLAITFGSIGSLKRIQKNFISAEKHFKEAIKIAENAKNSEEIMSVFLEKMAKLMQDMGKFAEVENYNKQALQVLKKLKKQ